ncbi:ABC transporter permease [Streptomyces anulatus]|uniref:ABC transporter permease n=1 Tax=Streptomyces TaxID=1883 RepID=UPI000851E110|nr:MULTISPECIES: FtsX-like permease family protein [Streptomyces]MBQ1109533.1 ABC transporter permease [Streptomyces sp. 404i]MBQ1114238.1 ABC transporter permease [Streptomyces sp. C3-3]MDQ0698175.1 putative ABC transport system permease protein [Streptomyces sp. W4I9-2]MDX3487682.1 FtsX-like permease family protein [Streptomyces sp. ID05-18]WIY76627.1 FtsX-like permease family protein [Streptomyces anulatus]
MFRTALRNVLAHKARLLMTVLAVMLGVAFVSGTLVFTDTLGNAFRKQSAKSYDNVAVSVETFAGDDEKTYGIDEATLEKIRGMDGVASATGRVSGFAGVADPDGKLIGNGWSNTGANFAPGKDGKDASYVFTDGSGPAKNDSVALDKDTASKGKYRVGDPVRVATNGPVKEYTLSGIFTTEDGAVNAGGSLVLFDTATAQQLYLRPGVFQNATVSAAGGVSDQKLLSAIKPLLPEDATAQTGKALADQQAKDIESGMAGLNGMLLAFAGIALFVGIFLIANTFSMLIAQRTRELALMRAIGATRRQVKRSVLLEAAVVGTLASVIGFALGLGLATGLRSAMGLLGGKIPAGPLVVSPTAVGSAFAVGILITVLAAWLPARRAAKIAPVAAMSSVHATASTKSLVLRNSIGGVIALIGAAGIVGGAGAGGTSGRQLVAGGAFFALIGVIILIPLLSRPVIALVRPLLKKLFGVSGKLASQNAVRNPRRTGATASALAIGLTLVTGISVLGVTLGQAIDKMTTDNIKADYLISMANGGPLDQSALTALEKADGVSALSPQQAAWFEVDGGGYSASGVTPGDVEQVFSLKTVSGSLGSLKDGQVAVGSKTAKTHGWKTGDTIPVTFEDDKKGKVTVGALYEENEFLSPFVIPKALADEHSTSTRPEIREIWIKADGGASSANEKSIVDALGDNPAMSVMDRQDIRDSFGGFINTALNIMYGLLAMALLIAVLGVVNTLAMSVFERQQEIGMLRAIGLDRGRVKRMIRLEAVVISLFGAVIGVGLGVFLGWAIGRTLSADIPGYALVIPWDRLGVFLLLACLVGVLASLWPARSAAKLNMLTAIKTE